MTRPFKSSEDEIPDRMNLRLWTRSVLLAPGYAEVTEGPEPLAFPRRHRRLSRMTFRALAGAGPQVLLAVEKQLELTALDPEDLRSRTRLVLCLAGVLA